MFIQQDYISLSILSQLRCSTKDLIELLILFRERNIELVSLKENIVTNTPSEKMMFNL